MSRSAPAPAPAPSTTAHRSLNFLMAAACGIAVANNYYNQPLLGIMLDDLGTGAAIIPTATQLGYALGLFLLVPLGDLIERRRLIVGQFLLLALALVGMTLAPNAALAITAALLVGLLSTVAQQIVPLAAHLAAPERRGSVVGIVMAGLLCGILLSRTLAGFVGEHQGWREMFGLSVPLALCTAALLAWRLPQSRPDAGLPYPRLMHSMLGLWAEFPELRRAALTQGLLFGTFSVFWTVLALRLQAPMFELGADAAGLFGVVGIIGVFAAPLAGRHADRHGARPVILLGAGLSVLAWAVFGLWSTVIGMAAGVIVLDFAVQSALIAHQHIIYALRPEARARINTVFMGIMFIGGAAGSAGAMAIWPHYGWSGAVTLGAVMGLGACLLQVGARHR